MAIGASSLTFQAKLVIESKAVTKLITQN